MTADEIRNIHEVVSSKPLTLEDVSEAGSWKASSAQFVVLREIAAQLAEANELYRRELHHRYGDDL